MSRPHAPLKFFARTALVGTSLSLAACQSAATAADAQLPAYQTAKANQQAHSSLSQLPANNQWAAMQTGTRSDVPTGVLQTGSIILRRSSVVEKPIPPEELAARVQRIAQEAADARLAQETPLILAAADEKIATAATALKSYADENKRQLALRTAEEFEAQQAKLNNLEENTGLQLAAIKDYTQQGTQIAELKATQRAEDTARQVASQVEGRTRTMLVDELALRQQLNTANLAATKAQGEANLAQSMWATGSQIQATQAQLAQLAAQTTQALAEVKAQQQTLAQAGKDYARAEALSAQLEAQKTAIQQAQASAQKAEANAREFASTQVAMAEIKRGFDRQESNRQFAELKAAQAAQAELTRQATVAVATGLKQYADQQIASLQNETAKTIEATARISQQSTDSLASQTALRLAQFRAEAANRSEQTASTLATRFEKQLKTAQKETEDKALKPDQVLALANVAIEDATPQLRAIALQSLADSQDYIRTIAQESLTDEADPKVQEALQNAAKNVITKDDQVVFAIRQALVTPVSSSTATGPRTVLGNGHGFAGDILPPPSILGADVALDPNRLRVAPIGGAEIEPAAGDIGKVPTQLASLNPKSASMGNPRYKQDWLDLRKYRVVVHEDSRTLENLMDVLMAEAEPYVGPWKIKWKVSKENEDLMAERFSLDAETTFADFVTYISQYILNERGVKLSFNLFDAERILVISD